MGAMGLGGAVFFSPLLGLLWMANGCGSWGQVGGIHQ